MSKKLIVLAVIISLLLPALPAHADGPITLGMGMISSIAMSPDGKQLAVGTTIGVYFYDPVTFAPQGFWNTGYEVDYLRWSPRGDMLALEHDYYDVDFWSVANDKRIWSTQVCYQCAIIFDSEGAVVKIAADSLTSNAFDSLTGASLGAVPGYLGPRVDWIISLSPDRAWQAQVDTGGNLYLHLAAGSHSRSLFLYNSGLDYSRNLAWSIDSRELFSTANNTVTVWDVATGQRLRVLDGFSAVVGQVLWTPDGGHVVSAEDGRLVLSDVASRLPTQAGALASWTSLMVMDPTSRWTAVTNYDGVVSIYDTKTLQKVYQVKSGRYAGALALSPDGQILAIGGNGPFINIRDASSGQPMFDLLGSSTTPAILALTFSPDGQTLTALEADSTLRHWNLAARTSTAIHLSIGSAQGRFYRGVIDLTANRVVLGGSLTGIVVDDATTGELIQVVNTQNYAWSLAVNLQGTRLAIGDQDFLEIWDLETGQRLVSEPHEAVFSVAFSPDGRSLASGGYGFVKIWPVP